MDYRFTKQVQQVKPSAVRGILKLTQGRKIVSLAGGLPNEDLFPTEAIRDAAARVFNSGNRIFQYGLTEGSTALRGKICERLRVRKQMNVEVEDMILTTGSQQAIDLLTRVYLNPGDVVLVENPTYLACLQILKFREVQVVAVESDAEGMDMHDLAAKIAQYSPKLVYVVPTFSNPTGNVWSLERRQGLLQQCREHNILILEDDPYGELQFQTGTSGNGGLKHYPTIFSLDQHPNDCAVVYTSTFSKTVAPALRTGWAVGDRRIIQMMARAKEASDLHSSMLDQQILYELLSAQDFSLDEHIEVIRKEYEDRMNFMISLMDRGAWRDTKWVTPQGGMFLWVELPDGLDSEALLRCSLEKDVAFVPGIDFYPGEPKRNTMRLNFTHSSYEQLRIGMNSLGEAIGEFTARS